MSSPSQHASFEWGKIFVSVLIISVLYPVSNFLLGWMLRNAEVVGLSLVTGYGGGFAFIFYYLLFSIVFFVVAGFIVSSRFQEEKLKKFRVFLALLLGFMIGILLIGILIGINQVR